MSEFFQLKKIDEELQRLINPVTFSEINPVNTEEEKSYVLRNPDYDPYFLYPEPNYRFEKIQESLHSIDEHDSFMGSILNDKRNNYIDKCQMILNRGSDRFSIFSRKVYGSPKNSVLDRSAGFLPLDIEIDEPSISSKETVNMIQAEMNHYGFGYTTGTKRIAAKADVLVSKKSIFIQENARFSSNFVRRLIVHEIGTHVLRAENGREQPFKIFFHGFPNYLGTEEGLAVVNEERFGLLNNETLKTYAARAIAVKMALDKSFSEIYQYLCGHFPPDKAFAITTRAKRGIADTSRPGGCTKDYLYIDGYLKVKEYLDNGRDINRLYVGKIGLEHINILKDVKGLVRPRYLPKNTTFKSLLSF